MKKIRIGLIGYGGIGRAHAAAYRALGFHYGLPADTIQITGVATRHLETARAAAGEIGCANAFDDYHALLERPDVDAVDVMTPNRQHAQVVIDAAAAGKHIYCEKPMAATVPEAESMATAVEQAGVVNQLTYNVRFIPAVMRAKQMLADGVLGDIFSFHARYYRSSYIDPNKPISWRLQREHDGGALTDLGSHVIDMVYHLLGPVARVRAALPTLIAQRPQTKGSADMAPVDVDDYNLLQVQMGDGSWGAVEVSRMATGVPNDLRFEIYGHKGALRFSSADPSWLEYYDVSEGERAGFRRIQTVQRYAGQKSPDWSMPPGFLRSHAECQYRFLRAIETGSSASPDFAEGLAVQRIIAAAQASDASGAWVTVDDGSQ